MIAFGQGGVDLAPNRLRGAFLGWQCRVRQRAMREHEGRPDNATMPSVYLADETKPAGLVITILNKTSLCCVLAELEHISARTNDPAERRHEAIRFLSAGYYEEGTEFSDILTATFTACSLGARAICASGRVRLVFDSLAQRFDLLCTVSRLGENDRMWRATVAHNRLFNSTLTGDVQVLAFEPDWAESSVDPPV